MKKIKYVTLSVCLLLCSANGIAMLKPLKSISFPSYKTMGLTAGGMSVVGLSYLLYKKKYLRNKIVRIIRKNPKKIVACASIISALSLAYYYGFFDFAKSSMHKLLYGSDDKAIADGGNVGDLPTSGLDGQETDESLDLFGLDDSVIDNNK